MRLVPAILAAAVLAAPCTAAAQMVRGVVQHQDSGEPVHGAIVALLDEAAAVQSSTLSDEAGRFVLRARTGGRFMLRVQRIGFHDAGTPLFELRAGSTLDRTILVAPAAIVLEGITAEARRRCVARPTDGRVVATLWEEARKALTATQLGRERYRFTVSHYTRRLELQSLRPIRERSEYRTGRAGSSPLVSMPVEQLLTRGFIEPTDTGTMYYAPDAHVLLSDEFLDAYCFRLAHDAPGTAGLIGLAFEPVTRRGPPAVEGILWLDRVTFELRYLEYRYTRVGLPEGPVHQLGGRVEFEALPNGIWIVRGYWIRMPVTEWRTVVWGPAGRRSTLVMTGIDEEGGEVLEIAETGRPRPERRPL